MVSRVNNPDDPAKMRLEKMMVQSEKMLSLGGPSVQEDNTNTGLRPVQKGGNQ